MSSRRSLATGSVQGDRHQDALLDLLVEQIDGTVRGDDPVGLRLVAVVERRAGVAEHRVRPLAELDDAGEQVVELVFEVRAHGPTSVRTLTSR